ncbi:MAG: hypothetical protein COA50_04295 [Flavobacteriaceae bacterium]|nr:MAG: hypothetical protein COA50_04295 [Flavobacteriaceae bacterium]
MNKNNLDNLFQEKLKGFEDIPDEKVWRSIAASLEKKKKTRKVVPIWWRLGGVAAALAILLYVINPFGNTTDSNIIITDVENTLPNTGEEINTDKNLIVPANQNKEVQVVSGEETKLNLEIDEIGGANTQYTTNDAIANILSEKIIQKNSQITAIENSNQQSNKSVENTNLKSFDLPSNTNEEVVAVENDMDTSEKNTDKISLKYEEAVQNILNETNTKEAIALNEDEKKNLEKDPSKKSIFEAIDETEDELVVENNSKKWSVEPSIAPVYFNGIGNGSPIHSDFISNSKSGDVNLSFGVNISYDISKKLSVRSGIHKVDYGYNTNNIAFSSTLSGINDIANIDYTDNSRNIVVESNLKPSAFDVSSKETSFADTSLDGSMLQQFGYIEMPIELNYALVDKKIGINLIGGFSSMFLMDNNVILESDGLSTEIGKANNINAINFSTNIGFGINYKLTPKAQFNIEPMFKYHLNTFSETSGNFQPYSIGVYTGIKFKF